MEKRRVEKDRGSAGCVGVSCTYLAFSQSALTSASGIGLQVRSVSIWRSMSVTDIFRSMGGAA